MFLLKKLISFLTRCRDGVPKLFRRLISNLVKTFKLTSTPKL